MSIQAHSQPSKELMIFSVFRSSESLQQNINNHVLTKELLNAKTLKFKGVEGVYKGSKEFSFMVVLDKSGIKEYLKDIALLHCQESVLILGCIQAHGLRRATLYYLDGRSAYIEQIGYFRSRNKEIAQKLDSYTFDYTTGEYYVVEPSYTEAVFMK